ncbi:MAG: dihydropteroate synthase [Candidatus Omnitrophota bacterium]
MGILNLTPDSFSGDGLYRLQAASSKLEANKIINIAKEMMKDGADILDIGGESSRPGAKPISVKEELNRVIPLIKVLAKKIKIPLSIDTYKHEVAQAALDNGASFVNDITALSDKKMPEIIKKYDAAVVLMHMQGRPQDMQNRPHYKSLIPEIIKYLSKKIEIAVDSGINPDKIIIDPGIGFGKTAEHNLEIINRLREFEVLKRPILVGPSRKSFIGKILNKDVQERIFGTAAAVALSIAQGAHIVRMHDIGQMRNVADVCDAIIQCQIK